MLKVIEKLARIHSENCTAPLNPAPRFALDDVLFLATRIESNGL